MAKTITPRTNETLPVFLRRAMSLRDLSVEQLAAKLDQRVPKVAESWERQVKSWRSEDGPGALQRANAELLGDVLNAEFKTYVRQYATATPAPHLDDTELRQVIREEVSALLAPLEQILRRLDDLAPPVSGTGDP